MQTYLWTLQTWHNCFVRIMCKGSGVSKLNWSQQCGLYQQEQNWQVERRNYFMGGQKEKMEQLELALKQPCFEQGWNWRHSEVPSSLFFSVILTSKAQLYHLFLCSASACHFHLFCHQKCKGNEGYFKSWLLALEALLHQQRAWVAPQVQLGVLLFC